MLPLVETGAGAFLAGLAVSPHCGAMCAPLTCALGPWRATADQRLGFTTAYHLTRTLAYALLGGLAGLLGAEVRALDGLAAHGLPSLGDGGLPVRPRARARPGLSRPGFPAPSARPLDGAHARPRPGVRRRSARSAEPAPAVRTSACPVRARPAERARPARGRDRLRLRPRHDPLLWAAQMGYPPAHPAAGRSAKHPPAARPGRPRRRRAPREDWSGSTPRAMSASEAACRHARLPPS
jgi:hypothetical protein